MLILLFHWFSASPGNGKVGQERQMHWSSKLAFARRRFRLHYHILFLFDEFAKTEAPSPSHTAVTFLSRYKLKSYDFDDYRNITIVRRSERTEIKRRNDYFAHEIFIRNTLVTKKKCFHDFWCSFKINIHRSAHRQFLRVYRIGNLYEISRVMIISNFQ